MITAFWFGFPGDGNTFHPIDSIVANDNKLVYRVNEKHLPGNNYYMIRFTNRQTGGIVKSKIVQVIPEIKAGFHIYPVPFEDKFFVSYEQGVHPLQVLLTDLSGRTIHSSYSVQENKRLVMIKVIDRLETRLYIVHLKTDKSIIAKTVFKR